jgi:hypothetical protein
MTPNKPQERPRSIEVVLSQVGSEICNFCGKEVFELTSCTNAGQASFCRHNK